MTPSAGLTAMGRGIGTPIIHPAGNRLSDSSLPGEWSYNDANQLLQSPAAGYDYNPRGAATTIGERQLHYGAEGRLTSVEEDGSELASYQYDPFGRRISKTVNGVTTYFFYDDEGLVAELDDQGSTIRRYGYEPQAMWGTAPLFLWTNEQYHYYLTDHLGTPQRLVRANGAVSWAARYEAFGRAEVVEDQVTNPLRFPGQYYDEETGTHYNFHRDYDPGVGRYLQSDPIGLLGGGNTYQYAYNNPMKFADPYGLNPMCFFWPIGTGACVVIGGTAAVALVRCTKEIGDGVQEGISAAESYRSSSEKQQDAIDCVLDPHCSSDDAQELLNESQDALEDAIESHAEFGRKWGQNIPGTSATGPVPNHPVDGVSWIIIHEAVNMPPPCQSGDECVNHGE